MSKALINHKQPALAVDNWDYNFSNEEIIKLRLEYEESANTWQPSRHFTKKHFQGT